jgi:hypothetical protein
MAQVDKIRVFVAYTGEMRRECDCVRRAAHDLNITLGNSFGVMLEVLDWRTHVHPDSGRPEQIILDQLDVRTWDIFVGLLWTRFGTPTGGIASNGAPYQSGTQEEFSIARQSWQEWGKPRLLVYRCTRKVSPDGETHAELAKVEEFFKSFAHDGDHPGLFRAFRTTAEFSRVVHSDLTLVLFEYARSKLSHRVSTENLNASGFLDFFTPSMNAVRNQRKKEVLCNERRFVNLLAHVGHSYLASVGQIFAEELFLCLEKGASVQINILNPWSETGALIVAGEADADISADREQSQQLDIVSKIENSRYYRFSFLQVIDQYRRLQKKFGAAVELRLTTRSIPSTVLLTSDCGFFEPYMSADLEHKLTRGLHAFEVQFSNESYFYHHTTAYFNAIWRESISVEDYLAKELDYRQRMLDRYT